MAGRDAERAYRNNQYEIELLRGGYVRSTSMAPRANWKGYLRLSLVSCPIALFPATSEREKVRFHQINKETGNRIRLLRVDEKTGKEVPYEDII
jgi:hypothetical protein